MKIPPDLAGSQKKFAVVGERKKFYVIKGHKESLKELRKHVSVYQPLKGMLISKSLRFLSLTIPYQIVDTKADFIYEGNNTHFFDFEGKTVTTVFKDLDAMKQHTRWAKKLSGTVPCPEILNKDNKHRSITTKYTDFEFLSIKGFVGQTGELFGMRKAIEGTKKVNVTVKKFLQTLNETQRALIAKRFKERGIDAKKIMLARSHGDFHPGKIPRYAARFYMLDFDSIAQLPGIMDFVNFAFLPVHHNQGDARWGMRVFEKFLERETTTPAELVISLSMLHPENQKLQTYFEKQNLFMDL